MSAPPTRLHPTMDELFAPPEHAWRGISRRYRDLRWLTSAIGFVVLSIPAVVVGVLTDLWWISAIIWGAAVLLIGWRVIRAHRYWKSWGYAELGDDLFITHGLWFKQLTVVPYGRMQVVEVESGPLERAFKMATVKLVTASASTDATIPGLPPEEAAQLRDRLTQKGEERASGL